MRFKIYKARLNSSNQNQKQATSDDQAEIKSKCGRHNLAPKKDRVEDLAAEGTRQY